MSETVNTAIDASIVADTAWPFMVAPKTKSRRQAGFQSLMRRSVLDQLFSTKVRIASSACA